MVGIAKASSGTCNRYAGEARAERHPFHLGPAAVRIDVAVGIAYAKSAFHAGHERPCRRVLYVAARRYAERATSFPCSDETQKKAILKGLFENYYAAQQDKVVFDTNRLWCTKMPALADLFPDAKVIACVRQTAWIVDSIESLIRRNPFEMSKIFNFDAGGTVYSRAEGVSAGNGMVGYAMNALKEAYYGQHTGNLMLLRYETLTSNPAEAMKAVYDFVGEKPFKHDFDNVKFDADEFDIRLGTPGLHRVGRQVKRETRKKTCRRISSATRTTISVIRC